MNYQKNLNKELIAFYQSDEANISPIITIWV